MPGGDGTGPLGQGPARGRGRGYGAGRRGGNAGSAGQCVCPQCGARITHQPGTPCSNTKCPQCGAMMVRE